MRISVDFRFCGNDKKGSKSTFYESIIFYCGNIISGRSETPRNDFYSATNGF